MDQVEVVVVGAGHAGLAMSNVLTARGVEHVLLERDGVASNWQRQRWDSFTLLTPNWATWLPGWHYTGQQPHGFMGRDEMVTYLHRYAASFGAPVRSGVQVLRIERSGAGHRLHTSDGEVRARAVVLATGPFQRPRVPAWCSALPADLEQLHSSEYRSADGLPEGGVLVVGSGPSGQQIAEDLVRAGRRVHLSVGRHRRVPRRYRGRDYYWWLELGGFYERTAADVPARLRRGGVAPALTGFDGGHDLDLRQLHADGVTLLGRAVGATGSRLQLDDSLAANLAAGDRAYPEFTAWVEGRLHRFDGMYDAAEPQVRLPDPPAPPSELDLTAAGIRSVIWATGFEPDLRDCVAEPVFDPEGRLVHERGVTPEPGLYVIGQTWLHRLRSPFVRGAEEDVNHVASHLVSRAERDLVPGTHR